MLKIWLHEVTRKGACAQLPRYHFGSAKRFTLGQTCTSFQQRLQARRVASLGIADGNQEAQYVNAAGLKSQPSIHMRNPSTRRVRARAHAPSSARTYLNLRATKRTDRDRRRPPASKRV